MSSASQEKDGSTESPSDIDQFELQPESAPVPVPEEGRGVPGVDEAGRERREHADASRELFLLHHAEQQSHRYAWDSRDQSQLDRERRVDEAGGVGEYWLGRNSLGCGILPSQPELTGNLGGVQIPRWSVREQAPFPTRVEEYTFAYEALKRLQPANQGIGSKVVLDSGSGFNPEIHLMPEACARMGFDVIAVDGNPLCLSMPQRSGVTRVLADIRQLPYLDRGADAWVCISTLEHMAHEDRAVAIREGYRILKSGGLAVVTTDLNNPAQLSTWMSPFFDVGARIEPNPSVFLNPCVSWAVGVKRG